MRSPLPFILLSLATTACAHTPGSPIPAPVAVAEADRPSPNVLTARDFAEVGNPPTALDAVRRLRPNYLRAKVGVAGPKVGTPGVAVFINGAYAGGVDALADLATRHVAAIRLLTPHEIALIDGTARSRVGAIAVTLRQPE